MTIIRARPTVAKHTPVSKHETTCRNCRRTFTTRSLRTSCPTCWWAAHTKKKKRRTTKR